MFLVSWIYLVLCVTAEASGFHHDGTIENYGFRYLDYHLSHLKSELSIDTNDMSKKNLILPFNTTRVPGSPEALGIQEFIKSKFNMSLWELEEDNFQEKGYNYTNLIFTFKPLGNGEAEEDDDYDDDKDYIVLAAHYDTLISPKGFVGAMDSAASCSILLYIARFLQHAQRNDQYLMYPIIRDADKGIKILFFDGEEALVKWTDDDSIYGARHLASKWDSTGQNKDISLLALMDLIGASDELPIPSYFKNSHVYYKMLNEIENSYMDLARKGQRRPLTSTNNNGLKKSLDVHNLMYHQYNRNFMGDDHVPFYERNVPILHLIPSKFPATWHTIDDDYNHLDQQVIYKWALLMSEFALRSIEVPDSGVQ
ncbi:Uncharacterized protein RNJ44_04225 [Nakaseomyces bracarensis]|uniref:Peptide hydrolase n=1 Tax=Nakaseomyces bracarensis TaxID=273131 RepID=A0ABR4NU93_9SACH